MRYLAVTRRPRGPAQLCAHPRRLELLAVRARPLPRGARRWARPAARSPFGGGGGRAARLRSPIDGPDSTPLPPPHRRLRPRCADARLRHRRARRRGQLGRAADPRRHEGRASSARPPANFAPQAPLTQAALADAIRATDELQHSAEPTGADPRRRRSRRSSPRSPRTRRSAASSRGRSTRRAGPIDHVDFALDGKTHRTARAAPYDDVLDTRTLPDGTHQLAANVTFADGGCGDRGVDGHRRERSRCDPDSVDGPRHSRRLEVVGAAGRHGQRGAQANALPSSQRRRRPSRSSSSTQRSSATSGSATRRARSRRR